MSDSYLGSPSTTGSEQKRKFLSGGKFYHVNISKKRCPASGEVVSPAPIALAPIVLASASASLNPPLYEPAAPVKSTTVCGLSASTSASSAPSRLGLSPALNSNAPIIDLTADDAEITSSSCAPVLKAPTVTSLSPVPNSKASPNSSATVIERDVIDLTVDDADTLKAGDYLHFRKSFKDFKRTLRIRRIVKYTMVVEDRTSKAAVLEDQATMYEVVWKMFFDSPPDDEQYVTTLLERGGRRFQKVGTKHYVQLFQYNFVPCAEQNSWDITWEE